MWSIFSTVSKAVVAVGVVAGGAAGALAAGKKLLAEASSIHAQLQLALTQEANCTAALAAQVAAIPDKARAAVMEFLPQLRAKLQHMCDMNEVFHQIRARTSDRSMAVGQPSVEALWEEGKIRGLTRAITTAYAVALLTAILSVEIAVFTRMVSALPEAALAESHAESMLVTERSTAGMLSSTMAAAATMTVDQSNVVSLAELSHISAPSLHDYAVQQQADALRCIVENFMDSGLPRLCTNVRGAVAACACGSQWEVAPRSTLSETEEGTKGGSPSSEAVRLGVPPGHCSQASFLSLVRTIRMCIEHPTTLDFSDSSWVAHRGNSRYQPVLPLMDVTTGERRPTQPSVAAHQSVVWDASLLLHTTLDATASPAFQPVALHAIDCAFAVMQQLIASQCFKTGAEDAAGAKILPLAHLCVTFRTLSDKLLPSEAGIGEWQAQDVTSQVAVSRPLADFCKVVMWDAKL